MTDFELRFHHLKTIGTKSPEHLRALIDREMAGVVDDVSPSIELGDAVHSMAFETKVVTCYPGPTRRGKEWEAFRAQHAKALILAKNDYERARRMAEALTKHKDAVMALTGKREETLRWSQMGVKCRATPDVRGQSHLTELKTCRDAKPEKFQRQGTWYGYHAQLAWQETGVICNKLPKPSDCYIVAIESEEPYPVTVLRLTERALEQGHRMCSLWFERYMTCLESDSWPPYVQSIVPFDVPDDDELIFGDEEAA